jgi:LysR family transcriptional regulator, nitrogen assimilation regulatory protein
VDIHLLRAFLAVAETGSVSAAAERLGYSQPGLSHRVQLLERDMGVALFRRSRDGMTLTKEGQLLVPYARMTAHMLEDAEKAIADYREARRTSRKRKADKPKDETQTETE